MDRGVAFISILSKGLLYRKCWKRIYHAHSHKTCFYYCVLSNLSMVASKNNSAGSRKKKSKRRWKQRELASGEDTKKTRFSVQWANIHLSPEEIGKKYVITQTGDSENGEDLRQSQEWKDFISTLDLKQLEKWKQGGTVPTKLEFLRKSRRSSILSDEEIQTRRVTGKEFVTDKENELVKSVRERLKEQERKYVPSEELLIGSVSTLSEGRSNCVGYPREYEFAVIVNQAQAVEKLKQLVESILKRSVNARNIVIDKFGFQYRVGIRTQVLSLQEIKNVYAAMRENEHVAFSFG